jgi:hypothetical protein
VNGGNGASAEAEAAPAAPRTEVCA